MRRYGDAPKRGQKYKYRPGAYCILPRGDDLLLTFQSSPWPEIQLPGGGIDPGEGPTQALYREVFEETGWRIATPRKLGVFRRFVFMPEYDIYAEKVCHIYVAHPVRPHGPPREEGHIALWMNAHEAVAELSNSGDQAFLTAWNSYVSRRGE